VLLPDLAIDGPLDSWISNAPSVFVCAVPSNQSRFLPFAIEVLLHTATQWWFLDCVKRCRFHPSFFGFLVVSCGHGFSLFSLCFLKVSDYKADVSYVTNSPIRLTSSTTSRIGQGNIARSGSQAIRIGPTCTPPINETWLKPGNGLHESPLTELAAKLR